MKYRKDINFKELPANRIITGVPIDHEIFQEHEQYIIPRRNQSFWKTRIKEILANYNDKLNKIPHKYCVNCKRLEDGAHRYDVAKNYKNQKTRTVKTIPICFKGTKADFYHMFYKKIENEKLLIKHTEWLTANVKTKWNHFNEIDFRYKRVLVVGSNSGYSVLRSFQKGALLSVGYDTDLRLLNIGVSLTDKLNIEDRVKFINKDFLRADLKNEKFDIVFCMGLIHYFKPYQYEKLLRKLIDVSSDRIIIELRCINSDDTSLFPRVKQTMATTGYIKKFAKNNNLIIEKLVSRDEERWIVIFRKGE